MISAELINLTLNLSCGGLLGWGYAQLFLWRPKISLLGLLSALRILIAAIFSYLLLSCPQIQPIIVLIMFMGGFWCTILQHNRMI